MRIICPTCASHYDVETDKIGAAGQLVRCAQCREVWMVRPPVDQPLLSPRRITVGTGLAVPGPSAGMPIDFEAARTRLRRKEPALEGARERSGSVSLLSLAAACATALSLLIGFRAVVVSQVPAAAPAYAALGLPVDTAGLALRDVRSVVVADGAKSVLTLEGKIANLRNGPTAVPDLTVVVRDNAETPLYTWTAPAPKDKLAKGETVLFRSRLAAPPVDGRDVHVSFADAGAAITTR